MQTNTIINKLVETINTGDNTLYNIDELMLVYDFLFKSDWPERTLNRILDYYKSPLMYEEIISKLENKYSKRNFALLLSELYQEQNNLEGIKNIIVKLMVGIISKSNFSSQRLV
jgi:hypothetical protein